MKTIEERAWEIYPKKYRDRPIARTMEYAFDVNEDSRKGFVAGAQSEHEELTRWHDAKNDPPTHDAEVLCMVHRQFNTYEVCRYNKSGWWVKAPLPQGGWCGADCEIIAWRDIHD